MLKVIELFAGVGSQTQALKNIGIKHEVVGISEIDKYAIQSYIQLHGETYNFGDITGIIELPKADLWTYSFPCQDLSISGKQAGIKKGTRSGLLLEVERLLRCSKKPKYLLMENVKNLLSKKHKSDFDRWCNKLEELGYTNYYQVLNAKDYGIPQNRERVFMVSILGWHKPYVFPNKYEEVCLLKDFLEEEQFDYTIASSQEQSFKTSYITSKSNQVKKNNKLDNINYCIPKINNKIMPSCKINFHREYSDIIGTDKEIYQCKCKSGFQDNRIGIKVSPCLRASNPVTHVLDKGYTIRRLTPRECWKLMGWTDEQFDKIKGVSNTQLYKQAGNGIVVTVLEEIFRSLFDNVLNFYL